MSSTSSFETSRFGVSLPPATHSDTSVSFGRSRSSRTRAVKRYAPPSFAASFTFTASAPLLMVCSCASVSFSFPSVFPPRDELAERVVVAIGRRVVRRPCRHSPLDLRVRQTTARVVFCLDGRCRRRADEVRGLGRARFNLELGTPELLNLKTVRVFVPVALSEFELDARMAEVHRRREVQLHVEAHE